MIAGLRGILHKKSPSGVEIDVNGVFYACLVSYTTLERIGEPGEEVTLIVHTNVREDAIQLFGFLSDRERKLFLSLIGISGVGPKLAINMLSALSADDLAQAIVNGDLARLVSIPGVGKKTAERLLVELKDKLAKTLMLEPTESALPMHFKVESELTSALCNLGYKPKIVEKVVEKLGKRFAEDTPVEELIREALREMQR